MANKINELKKLCKEDPALYMERLRTQMSFTISEAAFIAPCTEKTIYKAIKNKELLLSVPTGAKEGKILRKDLEDWLKNNRIDMNTLQKLRSVIE